VKLDKLRSIVEVAPARVSDIDPYEIGVFKSDLANLASGTTEPPYVSRGIDINGRLDAAFSDEALTRNRRLIVLQGDPKSGKSRTLWEALGRHLPDRLVVALRRPLTSDEQDPAHKPLATFLDIGIKAPTEGLVVWVDDAHEHIEYGLTRDNLRRLVEAHPRVVIALRFLRRIDYAFGLAVRV
jgi:hypothetical protein